MMLSGHDWHAYGYYILLSLEFLIVVVVIAYLFDEIHVDVDSFPELI